MLILRTAVLVLRPNNLRPVIPTAIVVVVAMPNTHYIIIDESMCKGDHFAHM